MTKFSFACIALFLASSVLATGDRSGNEGRTVGIKTSIIKSIDYVLGIERGLNSDLPQHCKMGVTSNRNCTACDDGYYLVQNQERIQTCESCTDFLQACRLCESKVMLKNKDMVCTNCNFPNKPTEDLKRCETRVMFFYYLGGYLAVALVLGVLSFLETKRASAKTEDKEESGEMKKGLLTGN